MDKKMLKSILQKAVAIGSIAAAAVLIAEGAKPASGELNRALPEDAFHCIGGAMYITEGVTEEELENAQSAYSSLPGSIQDALEKKCRIYIYTEAEDDSMPFPWVGVTSYPQYTKYTDGNTIVAIEEDGMYEIEIEADALVRENGQVLLHEIGHFVDKSYKGGYAATHVQFPASETAEFENLCNEESGSLANIGITSADNTYNQHECFAEAFSNSFIYADRMWENCPGLMAYVEDVKADYGSYSDEEVHNPDYVIPDMPTAGDATISEDSVPMDDMTGKEIPPAVREVSVSNIKMEQEEVPDEAAEEPRTVTEFQNRPEPTETITYNGYVIKVTPEEKQRIEEKLGAEAEAEQIKAQMEAEAEAVRQAEARKAQATAPKGLWDTIMDMFIRIFG